MEEMSKRRKRGRGSLGERNERRESHGILKENLEIVETEM
jgi:hypothetical protein